MVERERRRLRRAFGLTLLAVAAQPVLHACVDDLELDPVDAGRGPDSSAIDTASEASIDDSATAGEDGWVFTEDVRCRPTITMVDDGAVKLDAGFDGADGDYLETCDLDLPCGLPNTLEPVGCDLLLIGSDGDASPIQCRVSNEAGCSDGGVPQPDAALTLICNCDLFIPGGRRPEGLRRVEKIAARDELGAYLARMAHDEAASVDAFERLASELARLGAPDELVSAALRSARDEVRHARIFTRLARRSGAEPPRPRRGASSRVRGLEAVARENAVEGCVHETYGALLAAWQSAHARDPALRRAFARVAIDETRHAALGWAIARWADGRLDAAAKRRVARARRAAVRKLGRALERSVAPSLVALAGAPEARHARALLDGAFRRLATS